MRNPIIYTHTGVDLDNCASVWGTIEFAPGYENAEVRFVDANWDGKLVGDDIALDIHAGGRGIKGTSSCFVEVAYRCFPEDAREALAELIRFIDIQDSKGSVVEDVFPSASREDIDLFQYTGINMTLAAIKSNNRGDDEKSMSQMMDIFDGLLSLGMHRMKSKVQIAECEIIGGNVAIVDNKSQGVTTEMLKKPGIKMVVYRNGRNIGILRSQDCDEPTASVETIKVVDDAGELESWYIDGRGFIFCRGTNKSPSKVKSKVNPFDLAEAACKALSKPEMAEACLS